MRHSHLPSNRMMLVAVVLFTAAASMAFADTAIWSVQPFGTVIQGNVVLVRVMNVGTVPATGSVTAEAVTSGGSFTRSATVSLAPGQSALVPLEFTQPVLSVGSVSTTNLGVSDDLNPF